MRQTVVPFNSLVKLEMGEKGEKVGACHFAEWDMPKEKNAIFFLLKKEIKDIIERTRRGKGRHDTQRNDIQHNDTQHIGLNCHTQHHAGCLVLIAMLSVDVSTVVMLSVVTLMERNQP
jgi:hypothetical protein